ANSRRNSALTPCAAGPREAAPYVGEDAEHHPAPGRSRQAAGRLQDASPVPGNPNEWREKVREEAVPGFLQGPINHDAHEDAAIFRNLGLPVPRQRELHRYPRPKPPEPIPLVGTAREIYTRYPSVSAETAAEFARQWADAMIESDEVAGCWSGAHR